MTGQMHGLHPVPITHPATKRMSCYLTNGCALRYSSANVITKGLIVFDPSNLGLARIATGVLLRPITVP